MNRAGLRFALAILVVYTTVVNISEADAPPNHHRYYFKEQHPLTIDVTRFAIFIESSIEQVAAELDASRIVGYELEQHSIDGWCIAKSARIQSFDEAKAALHRAPSVNFVSPVFVDDLGGPMWSTATILTQFAPNLERERIDDILRQHDLAIVHFHWGGLHNGCRVAGDFDDGLTVLQRANALAMLPEVLFAEPDFVFTGKSAGHSPNDPLFPSLWALENSGQAIGSPCASPGGTAGIDLNALEAWHVTNGAPTVLIVVIDNGVQLTHPDLNTDTSLGADFTGQSGGGNPVNQCDNHGTAVAGCVSARSNNAIGIAGIAPGCRVASARPFVASVPCDGSWSTQPSWTVSALDWAQSIGARVTNNSNEYGFTSSAIASKYAATRDAGMIHFASAGNDSLGTIDYPASLPTVNAVGAINQYGNLAVFSNWGTGIDFVGPGIDIVTTDRTGAAGYETDDYVCIPGTSFSSPYVAGIAGLLVSADPTLLPSEVEQIMQQTSHDLGIGGYDTTFGWGLPDAAAAMGAINPSPPANPILVCSAAQIQAIGTTPSLPSDGHYLLTCDIDMGATNWDPIGAGPTNWFSGVFDGQGHTISDLSIEWPNARFVGLFEVLLPSAIVKNLTLEIEQVRGQGHTIVGGNADGGVGALVGVNRGTIINCHVRKDRNSSEALVEVSPGSRVSALVGSNDDGRVISCSVADVLVQNDLGTDSASDQALVAGYNGGVILWCSAIGRVDGDNAGADGDEIGGLVGDNQNGKIIQSMSIASSVDGHVRVGGIAGRCFGPEGLIEDCFYGGIPTVPQNLVTGDEAIGGIAGRLQDGGSVRRSYVAASVDDTNNPEMEGAIAGDCIGGVITDCFGLTGTVSPLNQCNGGGSGCTMGVCSLPSMQQLQQQATFAEWDFQNVWWIEEGLSYPRLCGVGPALQTPEGVIAKADVPAVLLLQWNPVLYEGKCGPFYKVFRSISLNGAKVPLSNWMTEVSYLDATIVPGEQYYYWVKAAATWLELSETETLIARESDFSTVASGVAVPPVNADVNGDGSVGVPDLLAVINAWGPCAAPPALCPADIAPPPNGDGTVGVPDLLMVINNWG